MKVKQRLKCSFTDQVQKKTNVKKKRLPLIFYYHNEAKEKKEKKRASVVTGTIDSRLR